MLALFIPMQAPKEAPASRSSESLLRNLEHALHPWVAFGVLPIFAFANAGVSIAELSITDALHSVPLGIATGLFVGKQVGILALCWLAVQLRLASLPEGVGWWHLHGMALLCGIGFTMSLFIASLAFEQGGMDYAGLERLGILIGTLVSGFFGYILLRFTLAREVEAK